MTKKNIITILLIFFISYNIQAKVYYVTKDGNDTNIGSETFPWRTIQKAANSLVENDTVFIKEGIYNERVIVQNSGSPENQILFSNYQNEHVIIDGDGISWGSTWNGLFDVSSKSYIQIQGLNIINADYGGLWIENSDHIIIKNNYTYNSLSSGIGVWNCNDITIENNEIELACNNGDQECITVSNSYNCEVSWNNIHDNGMGTNGGEGIDIKEGSHDINVFQNIVHHLNNRLGIYADAWDLHTYNINIYQNIVHHCSEGGIAVASENGGLIENVNIYNNIIYNNKYDGIEIGAWSDIGFTGKKPINNIKIINNTCYKNGSYDDGWAYGINIDNPDAQNITIRNNICSENSAQISIQQNGTGEIVDHNLIYGNNIASGTLYGKDSIIGNPLFVDVDLFNFHLEYNSPAIDHGSSTTVPITDFDNNSRPSGMGFDIGAFEFNTMLNTQKNLHTENFMEVYPNPISGKLFIETNNQELQNYTFQLFDINGFLVIKEFKKKMENDVIIINRNNLVPGLYILNILADNKTVLNKKIILK